MKDYKPVQVEVCATSINSAIAADRAGAHRIELCDNISEGGTTPSAGLIKMCVNKLSLETWVMIRPRGGDFLYSDVEFDVMKEDTLIAKELGADGIVTGILNKDGKVDIVRMNELTELADPMPVAFHRAIDMCSDPFDALEKLMAIGVVRVLTSGLKNKAEDGISLINRLFDFAAGRIEIMAGSGINRGNIDSFLHKAKLDAVHLTGRSTTFSKMDYKPSNVILNSFGHEYDFQSMDSDREIIESIVRSCRYRQ